MDHLYHLYVVFIMLSCLFIVALWSPAEELLVLICDVLLCDFSLPMLYPWFHVVLDCIIPDLCHLSYFGSYLHRPIAC